jgi:hypothetical protein
LPPKYFGDRFFEGGAVGGGKLAERANDQALLDGRKDRLDGGGLEQAGGLPLVDPDFSRIIPAALILDMSCSAKAEHLVTTSGSAELKLS